jgi:hypothetical protein
VVIKTQIPNILPDACLTAVRAVRAVRQITNKLKIPMTELPNQARFGGWNFGHWNLFGICDLRFHAPRSDFYAFSL